MWWSSLAECVFCRIVDGVVAADVVWDDDEVLAFLDHSPVFKGHVLVVPKQHVTVLPDLPAERIGPYFARVQAIAAALPGALDGHGTFVAINNTVSQSVAHLHTHVIPRRFKDGLKGFFWPRVRYASADERAEFAARIRAALAGLT